MVERRLSTVGTRLDLDKDYEVERYSKMHGKWVSTGYVIFAKTTDEAQRQFDCYNKPPGYRWRTKPLLPGMEEEGVQT